jgi:hypothetical protein
MADTTRQVLVSVINALTGAPISGASLFLNGKKTSFPTSLEKSVTYLLEAQAAGFSNAVQTVTVRGNDDLSSQQVALSLKPAQQNVTIQIQFYPAQVSIAYTLTGTNSNTDSGTSGDGGLTVLTNTLPDTYTLTATADGYVTRTQTLDALSKRSFIVNMVKANGTSSSAVGTNQVQVYSPASDPQNVFLDTDISEDVYDNTTYQAYFTGAQVRLYIGNLFIDELYALQYQLMANVVPIFGYPSRYFDALGEGRSIVQGQLVLNFVHQGYLYAALSNTLRQQKQVQQSTNGTKIAQAMKGLGQFKASNNQAASAQVAQSLSSLLLNSSPDDIATAQTLLRTRPPTDPYAANPVYKRMFFDMRLEIGSGSYRSIRMLEKCRLGANEQLIDQSGQVIGEAYTFTARRLR